MTLRHYRVVGATGAWHLLRGNTSKDAKKMLSMAMWMATFVAPLQILAGDFHGLNTLEHQPIKVAAMEGHWERQKGAPFIILGLPDEENETNHFELEIPYASALILTHDINGETPGLKDAPEDRPPVATVFWSFRVMIGIGTMMMLIGLVSVWLLSRSIVHESTFLALGHSHGTVGLCRRCRRLDCH